ncbi:MAG: sensor histidine kinase, partial [Chloroflexi bacterium]|nr:sensor histidine kinase [Chloroflexota bacterium]
SLETAKGLMRQIEAENRKVINNLHPPQLNTHGLYPAIRAHLDAISRQYGLPVSMQLHGSPTRLPSNVEIAVFRIVQESLNNCLIHAQARQVELRLDFQPNTLILSVRDDGIGFDPQGVNPAGNASFGLVGMRERALSIGAQLEVCSAPSQGTQITLHVPLLDGPDDPSGHWEQRRSIRLAYTRPPLENPDGPHTHPDRR